MFIEESIIHYLAPFSGL